MTQTQRLIIHDITLSKPNSVIVYCAFFLNNLPKETILSEFAIVLKCYLHNRLGKKADWLNLT